MSNSNIVSNADNELIKPNVREEIIKVIETEFGKNAKIKNITGSAGFGGGENYASDLLRIKVNLELEDKTEKTASYIHKGMPTSEMGAQMVKMMCLLPTEADIYTNIIPKFEELYKAQGKTVRFGPKCCYVRSDREAFIMEDLKEKNFINTKRQLGLNIDHIQKSLKKLAEYHAASAVIFEKEGYSERLHTGAFTQEMFEMFEDMQKPMMKIYFECLDKNDNLRQYIRKFEKIQEQVKERFAEEMHHNPDEFNVLNHGDLWCNNIMYQYDENQNITETYFVDYALAKYGSPAQDLWYFLLSSSAPDLRISKFDYFIKYYHEHLVENLKLLQYSKKAPRLADLHIQLFKHSLWALSTVQGVLCIVLLDPTELATMDNFMSNTDDGVQFKIMSFTNPRYVEALEAIMPWLDYKGLLD